MPSTSDIHYEEIDCTIDLSRANVLSLALAVPIVIAFAGAFLAVWGWPDLKEGLAKFYAARVFLPALLIGIVVHEALHGIVWAIASGRPLSSMTYGIQWKTLTPYAHSRHPMPVGAYRAGGIAPFIGTAVLPALYAMWNGNGTVLAGTLFFGTVCGGDLMALWLLRRARTDDLVKDHDARAGGVVLRVTGPHGRD